MSGFMSSLVWANNGSGSLVPTISSLNYSVTDSVDGKVGVIATGTNLSSATIAINGISATVTGTTATTATFNAPAATAITRSAMPIFNGTSSSLEIAKTRPQLLGATGWTLTAFVIVSDDVPADPGNFQAYTLLTEAQQYVVIELHKTGVRVWQYNAAGTLAAVATVTIRMRGRHAVQARWTGTNIQIRVDGGAWSTAAQTQIGGSLSGFRIGSSWNEAFAFYKGVMVDYAVADSSLTDGQLDNMLAYYNETYQQYFGGVAASAFDPATLPFTAWYKPGNIAGTTWTGSASAGSSGSTNAVEASFPPSTTTDGYSGVYDVVATTVEGSSNAASLEIWAPFDEPSCTQLSEKPDYFAGYWAARFGSAITATGTAPAHTNDEPNFINTGYLETSADLVSYLSQTAGTVAVIVAPTDQNNPEVGGTPYANKQIWSKFSSGPLGLWNATDGADQWYGFHVYDSVSATYLVARRNVASLTSGRHMVVCTYSQANWIRISVNGSALASSSTAASGHPHSYAGELNLGADYSNTNGFAGSIRAVAMFDTAANDNLSTRLYEWSRSHLAVA